MPASSKPILQEPVFWGLTGHLAGKNMPLRKNMDKPVSLSRGAVKILPAVGLSLPARTCAVLLWID